MTQRFLSIFFLWAAALFAQTPYYGPNVPPGTSGGVQVQVYVYDETDVGSRKVETVVFNGRELDLQPPDIYGFRGGGGFQLKPGNYNLEWRVSLDKNAWPRSQSFKQSITVHPADTWVQVTIRGDKATVL